MSDAMENNRPHIIKDAKGKRPTFYETDGADQLMSMVMVLASELAVLHDRIDAQERVARQHGIDLAAGIEKLELDGQALQEREAWRQGFLDRLFYVARKDVSEIQGDQSSAAFNSTIEEIAVQ